MASKSFQDWEEEDWDLLITTLDRIQRDMHRSDAAADISIGADDAALEDIRDETPRDDQPPRESELKGIKKMIRVLKIVRPIRELTRRKKKGKGKKDKPDTVEVDRALLENLWCVTVTIYPRAHFC